MAQIDWEEVVRRVTYKGVNMTAHFLYFDTDNIAHFVKKRIKDGVVEIDGKTWFLDKTKPKMIKTTFGYSPLYILKWSSVNPSKQFKEVEPEFSDEGSGKNIDPDTLNKLMNLKILGNMLKIKKPPANWVVMLLIGLAFGAFVVYYLIAMKIITI